MDPESEEYSVLQPFWTLADVDCESRLLAAKQLLENPNVQNVKSLDHAYALKRLVKGLASSRGMARQGFVVALTQLLRSCKELEVKKVFNKLVEATETSSKMQGLELRENLFGRIFGCMALIRSGRCSEDDEMLGLIVNEAIDASKKKAWIEELALSVAIDAIESVKDSKLISLLKKGDGFGLVGKTWQDLTPNQLGFVAALDVRTTDFPEARELLEKMSYPILMPSDEDALVVTLEDLLGAITVSCHASPRLHTMWPMFLKAVLNRGLLSFKKLWDLLTANLVDQQSHERKYTALLVLVEATTLFASSGKANDAANVLLTPAFVVTIIVNMRNKKNILHNHVVKVLKDIGGHLQGEGIDRRARMLFVAAFERNEQMNKALLANISTNLFASKDIQSIDSELKYLKEQIKEQEKQSKEFNWALPQIAKIFKPLQDPKKRWEVASDISNFVAEVGFVTKSNEKKTDGDFVSRRNDFIAVVNAALGDATNVESTTLKSLEKGKISYKDIIAAKGGPLLCGSSAQAVNETLEKALKSGKKILAVELGEDEANARRAALDLAKSIQKARNSDSIEDGKLRIGLNCLLQHLALQTLLLSGNQETLHIDIAEITDDAVTCIRGLAESHGLLSKTKTGDGDKKNKVDQPDEVEVLVDVLVAVLSQPSSLLRNAVSMSFRFICGLLTPKALDIITEVLIAPNEESLGDIDEMDVDSEEEEEEDEEEDDDEEEEEEENPQKKKVSTKRPQSTSDDEEEGSSASENDDDDSDSLPDDPEDRKAELEKYDKALSAFVKAKMDSSKAGRQAKRTRAVVERITHKTRVLDLLVIFGTERSEEVISGAIAITLLRVGLVCFEANGMNFQGAKGEVARTLFVRVKSAMDSLLGSWSKSELSEWQSAKVDFDSEGACSKLMQLTVQETGKLDGKLEEKFANKGVTGQQLMSRLVEVSCASFIASPCNDLSSFAIHVTEATVNIAERFRIFDNYEVLENIFRVVVENFVCVKKTRISFNLLRKLCSKSPSIGYAMLIPLCDCSEKASRPQRRFETLTLIEICLKSPVATDDVISRSKAVLGSAISFLEEAKDPKDPVYTKAKVMRGPIKVLYALKRFMDKKDCKMKSSDLKPLKTILKYFLSDEGASSVPNSILTEMSQLMVKFFDEKQSGVALKSNKENKMKAKTERRAKKAAKKEAFLAKRKASGDLDKSSSEKKSKKQSNKRKKT